MAQEPSQSPSRPLRLALYEMSGLAGPMLAGLVGAERDVEVVTGLNPTGDLGADFRASGADLLICELETPEMERLWHAVAHPPLTVVNLVDDLRHGCVYALVPERRRIDVDAAALLDVARRRRA